jgi:hypothetical protein
MSKFIYAEIRLIEHGILMDRRFLPKPDLFASCPHDGNILQYYAGAFEAVYVCFNPFIRPSRISPERFFPESYPSDSEILEHCDPVSWSDVLNLSGLSSYAQVDQALKTYMLSLCSEFENEVNAKRLSNLFEKGIVMPPDRGNSSPFLWRAVMSKFKEIGHDWVWVGDEFCTERKLEWTEDVATNGPTPCHANLFTPDKSILWSSHWDSHFTLLCGSQSDLQRFSDEDLLEGFFCSPQTEIYWSTRPT